MTFLTTLFATSGGVSYLTSFVALAGFALMLVVVAATLNASTRELIRRFAWPIMIATGALFVLTEILIFQVPGDAYRQGLKDAIGRPDAACQVFEFDASGAIVTETVTQDGQQTEHKKKVKYILRARPLMVLEKGQIHFWLSNAALYPDGSHLCALPFNARNGNFAEQATKAWDKLNGKPGSGKRLQQLEQQLGQQGQSQGQGNGNGKPSDIIIELPSQDQQNGSDSDGSASESQDGQGQNGNGNSNGHNGNRGGDQQSEGSVTIQPPGLPERKQ